MAGSRGFFCPEVIWYGPVYLESQYCRSLKQNLLNKNTLELIYAVYPFSVELRCYVVCNEVLQWRRIKKKKEQIKLYLPDESPCLQ